MRASRPGSPSARPAGRLPERVAVAAALAAVLLYAWVAIVRMRFPFELEWIEGGTLTMVHRVLQGRPLYVAPSLGYVPFNYPPLFYWAGAALSRVIGDGFVPLRLLSFTASLACGALLFVIVRGTTRRTTAGWVAAGLFFASFRLAGAWFDLARSDSLHLALTLGAMAVLLRDRSRRRAPLLAAALAVLAALTKQSALVALLPMALWLLVADRRRGLWFAAAFAAGLALAVVSFDRESGGWFRYYVFELASRYAPDPALAGRFWIQDFLKPLSVCALGGVWAWTFPPAARPARGIEAAAIGGLVLASWSVRSYPATYDNVLMPACAAAAWLLGLGFDAVLARAETMPRPAAARVAWLATFAVALQFVLLLYDPLAQLPRPGDRAAGEALLSNLTEARGDVLVPCHEYLTARAGKRTYFHEMAFMAVAKSGDDSTAVRLRDQFQEAIAARRWGWVILDTRDWLYEMVAAAYEPRYQTFRTDAAFWPVTGLRRRPEAVFVPRADSLAERVRNTPAPREEHASTGSGEPNRPRLPRHRTRW